MKNIRKRLRLVLATVLALTSLYTPAWAADTFYASATPVRYDFFVDGESVSMWAYKIDGGGVYFKLRDLAAVLNGSEKQFEVSWDGGKNAVSLTAGEAYTPVGGELSEASGDMGAVAAYPSATSFYIDDRRIPMRAYLVNDAHYIRFPDLAANIRFAPAIDEEKRFAKIGTETYDTGLYSLFFLPEGWSAEGPVYDLQFSRSGEPAGNLFVYNYDPEAPLSQFQGNHAETLACEELSGLSFPAAKALIRRTQPAAALDDSYVDELHIYILLADSRCAFDFCFDSAKVDEQAALEIAKNFRPDEPAILHNTLASRWAKAVQDRDGKAQYELMNKELQADYYDYYDSCHWVTGVSSPWVNSWTIEVSGNSAVVFYENMTSTGFAGYTVDTLTFSEEDGQLKISRIDGYHAQFAASNARLPESSILLASLPDNDIFFYGDKNSLDGPGSNYNGLYLSINGTTKYFDWESTFKDAFFPELILEDVNSDGKRELIVILTTDEGTGIRQSEVHVIDPANFNAAPVTAPLAVIGENVTSAIVHENGAVTISITVNGKKSVTAHREDGAGGWAENEAAFGSIVRYAVNGAKLTSTIPAQVSNTLFVGYVTVTYAFDGNQYVMDSIKYTPYDETEARYSSRNEALEYFEEVSVDDVLNKGKAVPFSVAAENRDWIRPVHSDAWDEPAYREKYPGSSLQVEAALHRIFELPVGASESGSFYAPLGLGDEDTRMISEAFKPLSHIKTVGLLILNGRVENIVTLDRQTVVVAEPVRSGYQVILIDRDDLAKDKTLFQLVTPDGYEIDYLPVFFE